MKIIKGAIFDLDGTLLDSMKVWDGFAEVYLNSQQIKPRPELRNIIHTLSIWEAADYFRLEYGLKKSSKLIVDEINQMIEKAYFEDVKAKPGVKGFLKMLKENNVRMCIATATDRYQVEAALEREGLSSFFDHIFTCSEVGEGKQKPTIYLRALDFLNTSKSETWVFEDMLYACKTAKENQFPLIAIRDYFSQKDEAALKKLADYYANSFNELQDFFYCN